MQPGRAHLLVFLLLFTTSLPLPAHSQDKKKVSFRFKDASIDGFLAYVSEVTGLQVINESHVKGTIDAYSDAEIPIDQVLEFVDAVLKTKGATLERQGNILKVISLEDVRKRGVMVVSDPEKIAPGDQVITVVIPLKHLKVEDLDKILAGLLPQRPGVAPIAKDVEKNALIVTDTANQIRKALEIIRVLDVPPDYGLVRKTIELKRVDANDAAAMLSNILQPRSDPAGGRDQGFSVLRALAPRKDAPPEEGKLTGRGAAADLFKIVAEPRTNSLIVIATEENIKFIEGLARDLDAKAPGPLVLKQYSLKSVNAGTLSQSLTQMFQAEAQAGQPAGQLRTRMLQWYNTTELDTVVTSFPARIFFEQKSNSMLVVCTADQIKLIDKIIETVDYQTVVSTIPLVHASAQEVTTLLTQMLQGEGNAAKIAADIRTNQIVASGTEDQIARVKEIVASLDKQVSEALKTKTFRIRNADVGDVAKILNDLFKPTDEKEKSAYFVRQVQIIPDKRTNSILLRAPDAYFLMAEEIILQMDVASESETIALIPVKNRKVQEIALKLQQLLEEKPAAAPAPARPPETPKPEGDSKPQQEPRPPQDAVPSGGSKVQADEDTNSIIVRGAPRSIEAIRKLVADMDRFKPQALIQVMVAEVNLDNDLRYGVQWNYENKFRPSGDPKQRVDITPGIIPSNLTYTVVSGEFEVFLRSFAQDGRLKLLANPSIFVADGKTGSISIGKRVPFVDTTRQTPEGGILITVRYEDIGIKLKVTPKINPDNFVTMEAQAEISEFSQSETVPLSSGVNAPAFNKNSAETVVTVKHGQPVFLGGLIRELDDRIESKVPLLGDVPLLGNLFSTTTLRKQRRELVMLIKPFVATSQRELEEMTQAEVGKLKLLNERDLRTQNKRWMDDFSK